MTPDQPTAVPPGWYPDPHGVAELRWWDGSAWTDNIHNAVAPIPEYQVPGQIEDESGSAIFDLDYVPEATHEAKPSAQNAEPATHQTAGTDTSSPMHELFSVDAEPTEPAQSQPLVHTLPPAAEPPPAQPAQPPVTETPVVETPVVETPVVETPVVEPQAATPVVAVPPVSAEPIAAETFSATPDSAASASIPPVATPLTQAADPDRLPSRRELRQRAQQTQDGHESQPAQDALRVEPPLTGQDSENTAGAVSDSVAPMNLAPAASPTPAAAFDTSVPTSFNWAVDAPVAPSIPEPSAASEPTPAPALVPAVEQAPAEPAPVEPAPVEPAPAEPAPTPVADAQTESEAWPTAVPTQQVPDLAAFPPPAAPSVPDEPSGIGALGQQNAPLGFQSAPLGLQSAPLSASAPAAGADSAWAREDAPTGVTDPAGPPTGLPSSTASSWLMAFLPLIAGILSLGAVKGAENYPRYAPAGATWWMLVGGVLVVLYLVTVLLAVGDRKKLDDWGHAFPAHWAWAFATAPAYLIARTVEVKRQTGRMTLQLWVWILLTLIMVGAYFAASSLAPTLIAGYTLPLV